MPPQRDHEMAAMYGVPVETLRSRIHRYLWGSPDDEIVQGVYMRVATAKGMVDALTVTVPAPPAPGASSATAAPAPPPPPPVRCYLVPYLPPGDALEIRKLRTEAAPTLRKFKVCNAAVMDDKESYHLQILACLQELEGAESVLRQLHERLVKDQDLSEDVGLQVGAKITPLKIRCFLALLKEGKAEPARVLLKNFNLPLYNHIFQEIPGSPRGSTEAEINLLVDGSDNYLDQYPNETESASALGNHILGLVSMCDYHDKKRMAEDDPLLLEAVEDSLAQLGKRISVYQAMADEQSLIGAANPDFREL